MKDTFNLFRRIKTTEFFHALRILSPKENLMKNKLSLFLRLVDNEFTLDLINNLIEESKNSIINNSLINEIINIINKEDLEITIESLKLEVMSKLNEINYNKNQHENSNELTNEIRSKLSKSEINKTKIEELLSAFEPAIYENEYTDTE